MRYVLLFLFFSLLGAAIIFSFSGSDSDIAEEKFPVTTKPEARKKVVVSEEPSQKIVKKEEEKKKVKDFKEITYLEEKPSAEKKEVAKKNLVNLKTAKVVKNTPKSQLKKPVLKYKPVENPKLLVDSPIGDFFIQDHLKAVSPSSYNKGMGEIVAQGSGYYFINSNQATDHFPIVVKRSGRSSLALLTGLISIKTKDSSLPARLKQAYNLTEVQAFSHLNLYIYKTNQVQNLVSIYNSIKSEVGVDSAELEILSNRVRKL